jgi:nucleotide-binding universal stress UspA family protein
MPALRSIVAATDLSAPARHATDRAGRLAQDTGASLALVHAVSRHALDDLRRRLTSDAEHSVLDDARRRLHSLATELQQRHQLPVSELVLTGRVVEEIVRTAEQRQADLIVTGTRGSGYVRQMLLGSTAERVVKTAARPVLLARQPPHGAYRRVLLPVDFSDWSDAAAQMAARLAPGATFVLMHAVEVPYEGKLRHAGVDEAAIKQYRDQLCDEAQRRLVELGQRVGLPPDRCTLVTPESRDPWMQIVLQEMEQDCDLIVIGKHGHQAYEDLLLGSTTKRVIAESAVDVLVVKLAAP